MDGEKSALKRTWNNIFHSIPIILGILMLITLILTFVPASSFGKLFTGNKFIDPLIGSLVGSISSGSALVSYIIGGELRHQGVTLLAITAFLVSWVTVGMVQLPAEALTLGKKFAVIRNLTAFITSILVAIVTIVILG